MKMACVIVANTGSGNMQIPGFYRQDGDVDLIE